MTTEETPAVLATETAPFYRRWGFWAGSLISLAAICGIGVWIWNVVQTHPDGFSDSLRINPDNGIAASSGPTYPLPTVLVSNISSDILRKVYPHTAIPTRGPSWITSYTVQPGDTVDSIALQYDLQPASILWGNSALLQDNPNLLKPGQVLNILPVDGIFYKWEEGDTLEAVAKELKVNVDSIVEWPGNDINPLNPQIEPGTWVIIPGGFRPFQWEVPMPSSSGRSRTLGIGPGRCQGGYDGTQGIEPWAWPTHNDHHLSGYDFGPTHGGIDIALYMGEPIYSSQAGVIVFAGWNDSGYGILVIVDHLNGWHTFYAHLSQWNVICGQQVYTGTVLGLGGSTGNSSGAHLHFEMRYNGAPQNPHGLLP